MGSAAIRAGEAFIELSTRDGKLVKGLQNAAAQLKAFGEMAAESGRRMATFWTAVAAPGGMAVKVFASFDDQMRLCQATTQATGKDFELLTEKAKKLGRETSFTASQVASGMAALGRMGFKPKEIDEAIASVMDLSRVTGTDLAQASDIAANTMRMFGLSASKMTEVVDVLSVTANGSAQTLSDLFEGLKQAAPAAAGANENIRDVCTNLGILANMGIKGSMAGNALKKAYLQMADPKVRQYLDDTFGIVVTDANGNLRRMADILTDIAKAINGMPSAEKLSFLKEVFDIRGMTGAQGIIASIDQIEEFRRKLDESSGAAARSAKAMDAGVGGTLRILASQIEGVAIALGQALVPFLKGAADAIAPIISRITEWITQNGALITSIANVVTRNAMFGMTLWAIGKVLTVVSGQISAFHNILMACGNAIDRVKLWIGTASSAFLSGIAAIRDYGAALDLAREAMAANNGVLTAKTFTDIAGAAGIAATAANRYTMATLAMSNVEVGKKSLEWLSKLPDLFNDLCIKIHVYIANATTATAVNGVFAASCKAVKNALVGMWQAISSAVVSLAKYFASVGAAGAATAALGGIVKGLTVIVHGLRKALTLLAAHPIVAALTVALAVLAGTITAIASKCNEATEQAKREAEDAEKAYERTTKRTEKGQEDRRRGYANMEALQELAKASETSTLSAQEIENAVDLINSLEPFMGKGWAKINKTTGQIEMATDAMTKFSKAAQKQALLEADAEMKALKAQEIAVRKQMATYGGWRDQFWSPFHEYSADYNKQFEAQLDAIQAKQRVAMDRLAQIKKSSDQGIYGQQMQKTAAEKAREAARRREVMLKNFQDAEKATAEYEKKLADGRKTALEREIDSIEEAKKKYMEMLRVMIQYERQKPRQKQNRQKIDEWERKYAGAEAEARRLKQEARDRESKKAVDGIASERKSFEESRRNSRMRRNEDAVQREIDNVVESSPETGAKLLAALLKQSQQAARQAALEFDRTQKEAARPDRDGVVRYTDAEKARVQAARQRYEQRESFVDRYRAQLQRIQDSLGSRIKTVAGFDARALMRTFGGGKDSVAERTAKASEATRRIINDISTKLDKNVFAMR